jgi:ankyrin repeat protein
MVALDMTEINYYIVSTLKKRKLLWGRMFGFLCIVLAFSGCSPSILDASARGDVQQMEILLKESLDRVNYTDDLGKSAIHLAAVHNRLDSLQYLIEIKADLNAQDGTGQTALHIAAAGDHFHLLRALIQAGADVTILDDFGDSALHSAALHKSGF